MWGLWKGNAVYGGLLKTKTCTAFSYLNLACIIFCGWMEITQTPLLRVGRHNYLNLHSDSLNDGHTFPATTWLPESTQRLNGIFNSLIYTSGNLFFHLARPKWNFFWITEKSNLSKHPFKNTFDHSKWWYMRVFF